MKHIVLLGDSIFDSKEDFWKFWVGNKDTVTNLREQIPAEWTATLLAVDGNVTDDVAGQLANVPPGATHLFVSVGRKDALDEMDILEMPASSGANVLNELSNRVRAFEWRYSQMLDDVLALNKPTVVCTTYCPRVDNPKFFHAEQMKLCSALFVPFNDVMIRHALMRGLPLLDLRYVCDEYDGSLAGAQIVERIIHVVNKCDFSQKRTVIYANEVPANERLKGFTGIPLLLTAEEQKSHNITEDEIEAGKGGSPQIAALLTVRPENWSEQQKWKANELRELDFREREIFGFMEIERVQNEIGVAL
jgi:hypothetical protein